MQSLWRKISHIGIDESVPYADVKSSVFLNRICSIIILFVLTSLFINIAINDYNFVIPLGISAFFLFATFYLHASKKFILAKSTVIITLLGLLAYMIYRAGTGAGIEFYFLALTMLPAIVFTDKRIIYFFQALCILSLITQKMYEDIYAQAPINDLAIYRIFYIVNSIYSGLLIILALSFFKNQTRTGEQQLLDKNKLIEEKNASLQILNESLSRSNRDLEQFAYVASHDLKEPLRMISSFATLLSRKCAAGDDEVTEYNKYISEGVNRMQNLINDLLAYARIGSEDKSFTWVECQNIIEVIKKDLAITLAETDAQIQYDTLPKIYGIAPQIAQLFYNLISNAIKFRKSNEVPNVTIQCKKNSEAWLFSVKDNGIGIDEKYKEKVFVIFQRLHATDKYSGTGIGLALCKRIIERHGGKIWCDSTLGEGTTFFFTIPKPQFKPYVLN